MKAQNECLLQNAISTEQHLPLKDKLDQLSTHYSDFVTSCDTACLNLMDQAKQVEFPAGTIMFRECEPCSNFIWLIEGSVRVYKHSPDGREMTFYRVEPGDLCVLSLNSLLGRRPYPAEAIAETDITGLMLNGKKFIKGIDDSRTFRAYVMKILTERLHEMMTLVSEIAFQRLDLRLACLLGQRFERSGGEKLDVTHAELACELGTTREVVSRILKEFEHQKCIQLSRGKIQLISQQALEWISQVN